MPPRIRSLIVAGIDNKNHHWEGDLMEEKGLRSMAYILGYLDPSIFGLASTSKHVCSVSPRDAYAYTIPALTVDQTGVSCGVWGAKGAI